MHTTALQPDHCWLAVPCYRYACKPRYHCTFACECCRSCSGAHPSCTVMSCCCHAEQLQPLLLLCSGCPASSRRCCLHPAALPCHAASMLELPCSCHAGKLLLVMLCCCCPASSRCCCPSRSCSPGAGPVRHSGAACAQASAAQQAAEAAATPATGSRSNSGSGWSGGDASRHEVKRHSRPRRCALCLLVT
jgi:hypothetical protein